MHQKKKFSTGTSEYLNDLLLSLYYKCPVSRLVGSSTYKFENRKLLSSCLLAEAFNEHTKNKKLLIKFSIGTNYKFMLEVHKNKILFFEDSHEEITNKNDYFNLMVEHPINISYEDLLNLQSTFRKVIKKRNITIINIPYLIGEETHYGYSSVH